jgi:hypothetical protein
MVIKSALKLHKNPRLCKAGGGVNLLTAYVLQGRFPGESGLAVSQHDSFLLPYQYHRADVGRLTNIVLINTQAFRQQHIFLYYVSASALYGFFYGYLPQLAASFRKRQP